MDNYPYGDEVVFSESRRRNRERALLTTGSAQDKRGIYFAAFSIGKRCLSRSNQHKTFAKSLIYAVDLYR